MLYSLGYGCNLTLNEKQKRYMQDWYPVLTTIMSPLNMLLLNVDPAVSIFYREHYIEKCKRIEDALDRAHKVLRLSILCCMRVLYSNSA